MHDSVQWLPQSIMRLFKTTLKAEASPLKIHIWRRCYNSFSRLIDGSCRLIDCIQTQLQLPKQLHVCFFCLRWKTLRVIWFGTFEILQSFWHKKSCLFSNCWTKYWLSNDVIIAWQICSVISNLLTMLTDGVLCLLNLKFHFITPQNLTIFSTFKQKLH